MLIGQNIPLLPHRRDIICAAHGSIGIVEVLHMGGIAARMTPAGPGDFAFRFDVAVAAGFTDKFRPRANANQRGILAMQHTARLFHIHHQLRLPRNGRAKIVRRFNPGRCPALDRQIRVGPRFPTTVQNAYVLHTGVQHDLRHARCSIDVAAIQNDGRVVTDAVLRQHGFQFVI
ncbi:hypothetical protein D3C87_1471200 [compost metagenome]